MARIPTKEELGGASYGVARPEARFRPQEFSGDQAMGRAVQGLGDTIERTAAKVGATIKNQDEYEVTSKLVEFDLQQEKRLDDAKRTAAPEAKDFTASYRQGYDEQARAFMEGIPDHLKPKVDAALVRRGAGFEKRAYDFELQERDRYHVEDVNRKLTDLYNDSTATPDRWSENAQRGVALIRSSRLPVNTKLRTEREFLERNDEYAARARLEARAARGEDISDEIERLRQMPRGGWLQEERRKGPSSTIDFIKSQEGDKDSGWDYRQFSGPYGVRRGENERLTPTQAEERLKTEVADVEAQIDKRIKAPLSPEQRTALTSLFYNIGTGKGRPEQVAKLIEDGKSDQVPAWIRQFTRNADGGFMQGLADRRNREAELFASGGDYDPNDPGYRPPGEVKSGDQAGDMLLDEKDAPVESDNAPYRFLSPATRRKLLNVARTAQRGVMENVVSGTVARVRNGETLEKDEAGRTAFDRAVQHMTPHQRAEAEAKMQTARQYSDAVRGIQDKSADEAEAAIAPLGIMDGVPDNQVAAQERAFRDAITVWKRVETMRQKDPAAAVMGDPKSRIQPARELVEARDRIAKIDKSLPDYQARVWEETLAARAAAQQRLNPDREPRLLTKFEAQTLLPIPPGTKFSDPVFRTTLQRAADTAQQRFGPAYAKAALADAIRWTITGDDEKRMSAGILAKIAVGERLTAQDIRRAEQQRQIDQFRALPSPEQVEQRFGFAGGLTPPAAAQPEKPRENPFQRFLTPQGGSGR